MRRRWRSSASRFIQPQRALVSLQGTSYTYTIAAVDFHGNVSANATYNVTTPPANSVDPRRIGVFTTGSYWGGGGEQIDTLSGNLNFSFPLVTAQGRSGFKVPVGLSYNSQNWRYDGGTDWQLGTDTGFGFGWSMQIGSITPYYAEWSSGVDHYVYTDASGAAYRLDQNNGNIWSSLQGIYVWFDANRSQLHFNDGSFWVMGCISSGAEQDAGTMYPTVVEDISGNQVIVTYQAAVSLPAATVNTSARITGIEDVRRSVNTPQRTGVYQTYAFSYNTDPIPHLTSVANWIGTPENFPTFTYATAALAPPFNSSDPNYTGATTMQLTSIAVPAAGPTSTSSGLQAAGKYSFTYDSSAGSTSGANELTQVTFPWGGHLRWAYSSATYSGGRLLREIANRYLAADPAGAVEWGPYPFTHSDSGGTIQTVHADTTLADASGVGAKKWTFYNGTAYPWEVGLTTQFTQLTGASGTALTTDTYTWGQTVGQAPGNTAMPAIGPQPYISQKTHVLDTGGSNPQSALSTQTLDAYGNLVMEAIYPFNNTSSAVVRVQNTYLGASTGYYYFNCCSYAALTNYVLNRLLTTAVTDSVGAVHTPVQNLYDQAGYNSQPSSSPCTGVLYSSTASAGNEFDSFTSEEVNFWYARGLLTQTTTPAKSTCIQYDGYGGFSSSAGSDGSTLTAAADPSTNYAAPTALATESYNYSLSYNAWLGVTQTVGANGEQLTRYYDSYGRPSGDVSPFGYAVSYVYPTQAQAVLPTWQWKVGGDGYTYTILDGLGRAAQVKRGDGAGPKSYTSTVYAPCACSPMGKLQQTSQPYATTGSVAWTQPVTGDTLNWTSYTYDGIGRTLTVTQPDGVSVTTYSYSGNQTKVTDPAGNWKTFTTDVLGNLTTVTEPDPANPTTNTLATSYAYDWMNHLTCVDMTRGGTSVAAYTYTSNGITCLTTYTGGTRQTRTFVYNDAGQLTSATNPESGTVIYTYNTTGTVASKVDANGLTTIYWYDSYNNLTAVNPGTNPCATVTYTYGTSPAQYNYNRVVSATYGTLGQACVPGTMPTSYEEQYTYNQAGTVAQKLAWINRIWTDWNGNKQTLMGNWANGMTVNYQYDGWGHLAQRTYSGSDPFVADSWLVGAGYTYDTMGRLSGMTSGAYGPVWVQGVTYDPANRMTQMQYPQYSSVFDYMTETKTYHLNEQLTSMTWTPGASGQAAPSGSIAYSYTGTGHGGNNGQVVQAADGVSGETIAYQYDALKRLLSASSTPQSGSTPAAWTQSYSYDGFGNLTGKTLGGVTTAIPVNGATNQLTNLSYDANGNLLSGGLGPTMTYDGMNRVATATAGSGTEYYGYAPDNRRVYRRETNGTEEWTFYGAQGEKLATYGMTMECDDWTDPTTCEFVATPQTTNIWFGGKLIWSGTGAAGSSGPAFTDRLGTNRANGARFMPYGDEITSTASDRVKFATYLRSSFTGLDYADQRYYASAYGRFNTADPSSHSVHPKSPGSWNRYAYVGGDPVNHNDPRGLDQSVCTDPDDPDCPASPEPDPCWDLSLGLFDGSVNCGAPVDDGGGSDDGDGDSSGDNSPPPDCNSVLTADISAYLGSYANGVSPLDTAANIATLVAVGMADNVDPRLVVALAVAETSAGQHMGWGAYNAWNNGHRSYPNWNAAINGVTNNLSNNYIQEGLNNTTTLYAKYEATTGKVHQRQLGVLNNALTKMGGNTGALTDPCNPLNQRLPNQ